MKYLKLIVILGLVLTIAGCSKPVKLPAKDKHGKLPQDYIAAYYEAMNKNDLKAYKSLLSRGRYNQIVTKNGFLKKANESLLLDYSLNQFYKTTSYKIIPERCRFYKISAPGVFSVGVVAVRPNGKLNDEVCFKMFDNEWKLTDKMSGK